LEHLNPSPDTDTSDDFLVPTGEEIASDDVYTLEQQPDQPASGSQFGAILYEVLETLVLAVVIWLVVNFTTARYVVEGQSMEPNLHTGQYLIVNRLAYMQVGNLITLGSPQHGDIVVFDFPRNPTDDYVKRIIGLPGDHIVINDAGQVFVNGELLDEPYLSSMAGVPYHARTGTWDVPEGSYFVLGDNRNSSSDSRSWSFLERKYIVGKAWFSYWPPMYWGFVSHHQQTASP